MALAATTKDDLTAFTVFTPFGPNRAEGRDLVADLRAPTGPLAPPAGVSVLIGGGAADVTDVVNRVAADFPRTLLFIVVTTYIVLFLLLRSAVLPIKALVMNTLSIVASFGALVWIFQDGNLSSVLGFQPLGFVETTQPVILFCVLFGLSMDYEVFLLSRMKEVWDQTGDNTEAVARGLERSGRIVTSAALIVVVVALSFAFADIVLIKALGIGMALAVALDATVVRALLVPATMRLLGQLELVGAGVGTAGAGVRRLRCWASRSSSRAAAGRSSPRRRPPTRRRHPRRAAAPRPPDPVPIDFPEDDAPHDRLTEWWYYTGHLRDDAGGRYGFEFVIFRAERGGLPVSWASHLALTDETAGAFPTPSGRGSGRASTPPRPAAFRPRPIPASLEGSGTMGDAWRRRPATRSVRPRPTLRARPGAPSSIELAADRDEAARAPRHRWLDRLRAGRRVVLLLADGDGRRRQADRRRDRARGHRRGLVRPPVGRLHRRRRRRLGLVRGQPRRTAPT